MIFRDVTLIYTHFALQGSRGDRGEAGAKGDKVGKFISCSCNSSCCARTCTASHLLSALLSPQGAMGFPGMLGQKVSISIML